MYIHLFLMVILKTLSNHYLERFLKDFSLNVSQYLHVHVHYQLPYPVLTCANFTFIFHKTIHLNISNSVDVMYL